MKKIPFPTQRCGSCDVLDGPVGISCSNGKVVLEHPNLKLAFGHEISWRADPQTHWTVTFQESPCGRNEFDSTHPGCVISTLQYKEYFYKASLSGCHHPAQGLFKSYRWTASSFGK